MSLWREVTRPGKVPQKHCRRCGTDEGRRWRVPGPHGYVACELCMRKVIKDASAVVIAARRAQAEERGKA